MTQSMELESSPNSTTSAHSLKTQLNTAVESISSMNLHDQDNEEPLLIETLASTPSVPSSPSAPSTPLLGSTPVPDMIEEAESASPLREEIKNTTTVEYIPSPVAASPTLATTSSTMTTTTTTMEERRPASSAEGSFAQGEQLEGEEAKTIRRSLSRQELRRKSSFFNSKEIVINPQRYSTATFSSLRPIADPRFKSRFQNILSEWKARAGN